MVVELRFGKGDCWWIEEGRGGIVGTDITMEIHKLITYRPRPWTRGKHLPTTETNEITHFWDSYVYVNPLRGVHVQNRHTIYIQYLGEDLHSYMLCLAYLATPEAKG